MGVVYAARHVRYDEPVAVKVLHRPAEDPLRVQREVEAMAGLNHPHVVTVLDQGHVPAAVTSLPTGAPWIAMARAPGVALTRLLSDIPWTGIHAVLVNLLDALAHAHARGVVHRDLKPSNVLVDGPADAPYRVTLTDFGIAATRDLEHEAEVRGSLRYMAPEQLRGDRRNTGPWTDLYALGCLGWTLATGVPPFRADTLPKAVHQHTHDDPPPFRPRVAVPEGYEDWLRQLLEKSPGDRFVRAADAALGLSRLGDAMRPPAADDVCADDGGDTTLVGLLTPGTEDHTLVHFVGKATTCPAPRPRKAAPASLPPIPEHWQRPAATSAPPRLTGRALSLYGLRAIPLVGREGDRTILWDALRATASSGNPHAVVLEGQAGVGKSALARWLCERAHETGAAITLHATHGAQEGPDHGLVPMVARELRVQGLSPHEMAAELTRMVARSGRAEPELARTLTELLHPDLPDPGQTIDERYATLARALALRAAERPLVVWLDQVAWSAHSVHFMTQVLDGPSMPVLFVATAQDEALAERPDVRGLIQVLASHRAVRRLRLSPLPTDELAALVRHHLRLSDELASAITTRSAGNPMFAVQVLGDWVARGVLDPTDQGFVLTEEADGTLPDSLHAVWADRIERLLEGHPVEHRHALEVAAVLGSRIELDTWYEVLHGVQLPIPRGLVAALVDARLATPTDQGWDFTHHMLRESLTRGATEAGRIQDIHRSVADVLAVRDDEASLLRSAHHLLSAGLPERAVGPLAETARRRLQRDEAFASGAVLADLRRALTEARVPPDHPRWAMLSMLEVRARKARTQLDEAAALARHIREHARDHGWDRLEAEALTELADIARVRGELPDAVSAFHRTLDRYLALKDPQGVADTLRSLAHVVLQLGESDTARTLLADAAKRYTALGDRVGRALCLVGLGDVARTRQAWPEAAEAYRMALAVFRALDHRSGVALGLHGLAEVNRLTGFVAEATHGYREVVRIDEQLGRDASVPRLNLALCLLSTGAHDAAREELEPLAHRWAVQGRPGYLTYVRAAMLQVAATEGDWVAWRHHMDATQELVDLTGVVDLDLAALAETAAGQADDLGHPGAHRAWALAAEQWQTLGDDARAQAARAHLSA